MNRGASKEHTANEDEDFHVYRHWCCERSPRRHTKAEERRENPNTEKRRRLSFDRTAAAGHQSLLSAMASVRPNPPASIGGARPYFVADDTETWAKKLYFQ